MTEIVVTDLYYDLINCKTRYILFRGSTRSSKTSSIIQFLLSLMIDPKYEGLKIVIGVETLAQAKTGIKLDIEDWISRFGLSKKIRINRTEQSYTYDPTHGKLYLIPADKPSKWHGISADIFWFNEATHIPKSIFEQAQMRLPDRDDFDCKMILDYNPTNPYSWVRELENQQDLPGGLTTFISTYKDNPFLGKDQVDLIESWRETNFNKWLVYGRGEYGEVEGAIFRNWKVVPEFPKDVDFTLGIDFGFTNDPTAIIKVGRMDGEIYVQELCYKNQMTNQDIAKFLIDNKLDKCEIIADSAEPKSIEEIKRSGIRSIFPAKKGPDSIMNGIDILQRYKINIVSGSNNIIDEITNYIWKKDRVRGEFTNVPVDGWNHAIDPLRYIALSKFQMKSEGPSIVFRPVRKR